MDADDDGQGKGVEAGLDVRAERDRLSRVLLTATSALARGREPEAMLNEVCETLAGSTDHIRLAWARLGNLDADNLRPQFAAGPARSYAHDLVIDQGPVMRHGPTRSAIRCWCPVVADILTDPVFDDVRDHACELGLHSVMALPVGRRDAAPGGVVLIYADRADYFTAVGEDLFTAFTELVTVSLEQAGLMERLETLAHFDPLTGSLNRRGIEARLDEEAARARRHGRPLSLILFDIDHFKLINDRLGHRQGDAVLAAVARRVRDGLRIEDELGRWGGEEFLCLLPDTEAGEAARVAERLRALLDDALLPIQPNAVHTTASFGHATLPGDADDIDGLVAAADAALYQAKAAGRNRVVGAERVSQRVHRIGTMLKHALDEGRVVPAYQPIVDLATGEVVAEEALARLLTPEGDVVEAGGFIDAATQLQLVHRIDEAVIQRAFGDCMLGVQQGSNNRIHFINVSGDLLRHRDRVMALMASARQHCEACAGLQGQQKPMVIEITERELMDDIDTAAELLTPFLDFGLRLALDDFGTGFSSYRYLVELPIDFIKIEGRLIQRLDEPKVRAVVRGIQDTADELGITTLAEFVEDAATVERLREIGVHWAQGFHFGRPAVDDGPTPPMPGIPA